MKEWKTFDSKSFYISSAGERIECYGMIGFDAAGISYYTASQKAQFIKYKEIKYLSMESGSQLFINLPVNDNRSMLQKVIAFNDKYILTTYFGATTLDKACVLDWNGNLIENNIFAMNIKNNEDVLNVLKKYFNDCPQLSELVNKNKTEKRLPLAEISLVKCGDRGIEEFTPK